MLGAKYLIPVFLLLSLISSRAFDWQIQRYQGRDYVPLSNVAEFYSFPKDAANSGEALIYKNGSMSLEFTRDSREVTINGVKHWMSFPIAELNGHWFASRMDVSKTIDPALLPQTVKGFHPVNTVVIDAGHGGQDKGADGRVANEKDFTLDVARRLRNQLQKAGLRVIMTRNQDITVPLENRAKIANAQLNSIFVSIHFNAAPTGDAKGFEIFCVTPRGSPSTEYEQLTVRDMIAENGNQSEMQSFALANTIYHSMQGNLNMTDRGVKRARFAVLRLTDTPAVLVEGGFLSSPYDLRNVASRDWREKYATSIATGILAYKALCEKGIPPKTVAQYRQPPPAPAAPVPSVTPAVAADLKDVPIKSN
ncbi:MAG: N-acetylmuramoyl-L-alanine amidase [Chthoniobacterales bacterium]